MKAYKLPSSLKPRVVNTDMDDNCIKTSRSVDHFTVVCLVTWPMNESEARGDLALIQTPLPFLHTIPTNWHDNNIIIITKAGDHFSLTFI